MKQPISVFIADDHPIVLKGLKELISGDDRFSVVGEAQDGVAAWEGVQKFHPRVAVLDIDMPELGGLELAGRLAKARMKVAVVLLTYHKEENIFNSALELGIKGYLLKDNAVTDLLQAIDSAARDQFYVSPSLSGFLLNRTRRMEKWNSSHPDIEHLTPTELRVLRLVADNKTNREIGDRLTAKTHRANICSKLNLSGRRSLLMFAMERKSELIGYNLLPSDG